jgi:hypothetical protein
MRFVCLLSILVPFTSFAMPTAEEIRALPDAAPPARLAGFFNKRTISQAAAPSDDGLSPKFAAFRADYLKLTTGAEVDAWVKAAEARFAPGAEASPPDLQLASALVAASAPFHALAYRLSADAFWGDFSMAHSGALTVVKNLASANRVAFGFNDSDKAPEKAMFEYYTQPTAGMTQKNKFQSVAELQTFLCDKNQFFGQMETAGNRVFAVLKAWGTSTDETFQKNNRWLVWDNRFASSNRVFSGQPGPLAGTPAYRLMYVGRAEVNALLAGMSAAMAELSEYCAYDMSDSLAVSRKLGLSLGMDGMAQAFKLKAGFMGFGGAMEYGLTDRESIRVLKSFPRYLTLRDPSRMQDAQRYWLASLEFSHAALATVMAGDETNEHVVLRKSKIAPFQPDLERSRKLAVTLLTQDTVALAGAADYEGQQPVKVSVKKVFTNPPRDLKEFLPDPTDDSAFDHSSYWYNQKLEAKNYAFDRVVKWNNEALAPYLPDAAGKTGPEPLLSAVRALGQGASLIGQ